MLDSGEIINTGDREGDITFENGTMNAGLYNDDTFSKYIHYANLDFVTSQDGLTHAQSFDKFATYLSEKGITFKGYTKEQLLQSVKDATEHIENFTSYANINGFSVATFDEFKKGVAVYKNIIDGCEARYLSVIDNPVSTYEEEHNLRETLTGSLPALSVNGSVEASDSGVTLNATSTFSDGAWFGGLPNGYELALGLVKTDEEGKVRPETLLGLEKISDEDGEQKVNLSEEELKNHNPSSAVTFKQNAKYALPSALSQGEYKLVVYIKDSDGLRVTGFSEVTSSTSYEKIITLGEVELSYKTIDGNLTASSTVKISLTAEKYLGTFSSQADLFDYLRLQIVKNGYFVSGTAVLEKENESEWNAVDLSQAVSSGRYRLKFNLRASDGNIYSAFVYYEVE